MARGRQTDLPTAATAKAMHEMGIQTGEIASGLGVPEATVDDIVHGRHGWGRIHNTPLFNEYRVQQKRIMQTVSVELAKKALKQIEGKLLEASAAQAAVIYGILRDKERLDAGESTENVAVLHKHELDREQKALARLAASLLDESEPGNKEPPRK